MNLSQVYSPIKSSISIDAQSNARSWALLLSSIGIVICIITYLFSLDISSSHVPDQKTTGGGLGKAYPGETVQYSRL